MKKFLLLMPLLTLMACGKNPMSVQEAEPPVMGDPITLTQEESIRMVLLETEYTVTENDLMRQAEMLIGMIEQQETKTKGTVSKKRTPVLSDSIVSVHQLPTKSIDDFSGPDQAKVYIVSLGKDAGFGLFAGDKRGGGMIGYADEGDFDPATAPEEAAFLFELLTNYVAATVEETEAMRGDSIYERLAARFGFTGQQNGTKRPGLIEDDPTIMGPFDYSTKEFLDYKNIWVYDIGPLLTTKWGQGWPYNIIINEVHNKNAPAGCTTTAIAQIMNYHKHGSWNGNSYLWDSFENSWFAYPHPATKSIALLFFNITQGPNMETHIDNSGSSSKIERVPRTCINFGYSQGGVHDYGLDIIYKSLDQKLPVYMSGQNPYGLWQGSFGWQTTGHAWVVDGARFFHQYQTWRHYYYLQGQLVYTKNIDVYSSKYESLHHNWGWDGQYNCWLNTGVFAPDYSNNPGWNYANDKKIVPYIRPQ